MSITIILDFAAIFTLYLCPALNQSLMLYNELINVIALLYPVQKTIIIIIKINRS